MIYVFFEKMVFLNFIIYKLYFNNKTPPVIKPNDIPLNKLFLVVIQNIKLIVKKLIIKTNRILYNVFIDFILFGLVWFNLFFSFEIIF